VRRRVALLVCDRAVVALDAAVPPRVVGDSGASRERRGKGGQARATARKTSELTERPSDGRMRWWFAAMRRDHDQT